MKKKWKLLSVWSFVMSLAIFALAYYMYHYLTADGSFTTVFQEEAGKPFVTMLVGVWGVFFLFGSVMSFLVSQIFFHKEK